MAFLEPGEIHKAYKEACDEADIWREDYPEYERLMDNGLMEGLDENLPEVNDGSLAASLFKLAKRVIKKKLSGRAIALDRDDAWITEFANIYWEKKILKNANAMATPRRKWKDAVRKAAGYGGQPIITLFTDHGADFIVPYAQDVKLEAGKASDLDSDIIFWDVYYTKTQVKTMIEQAKEEMAEDKARKAEWQARKDQAEVASMMNPEMSQPFDEPEPQGYNKWDIAKLEELVADNPEEQRPGNEEHSEKQDKGVKKTGIHFYIAFQRGIEAPFYMCHNEDVVREWSNPDPTGDMPVHYLYCYQDFVNPYGIGIVKLAGGTQNVLDYLRQADILATQLGIRPGWMIGGDADSADLDSFVNAQDAMIFTGNAKVERNNLDNGIYQQLPGRVSMYQTSLQKMIPSGDTTISGTDSGDPQASKTPAGVKLQAANLSIDDEDFAENVDETYAMVAKSMINTHFANMQAADLLKVNSEERKILEKAGFTFPVAEDGTPTTEIDVEWDKARATFDFEVDPDADKTQDEEAALEGKLRAYELLQSNPSTAQQLAMGQPIILGSKSVDPGELMADILSSLTKNDKIVRDVTPEEQQNMADQQMQQQQAMMMQQGQGQGAPAPEQGASAPEQPAEGEITPEQAQVNVQAVMEQYGVDQNTAVAMLEAERQGFSPEEVVAALQRNTQPQGAING